MAAHWYEFFVGEKSWAHRWDDHRLIFFNDFSVFEHFQNFFSFHKLYSHHVMVDDFVMLDETFVFEIYQKKLQCKILSLLFGALEFECLQEPIFDKYRKKAFQMFLLS